MEFAVIKLPWKSPAVAPTSPPTSPRAPWLTWLGLGLIIFCVVIETGIWLVPFLPLPTAGKVALAGVVVAVGETAFWIGGVIVGKAIVMRFRHALDPRTWFRLLRKTLARSS